MLILTPAESLIMQCLWESGEDLTVYEITERLRDVYGKEYTNNAIATFMTVLRKKGVVSRYKKHHSHQYHPEITMDEYAKAQLGSIKDQWYHGSTKKLMASLVEISDITEDDVEELRGLLDDYSDRI